MQAGDAVEAAGKTRVMIGVSGWGHAVAADAGVRFADRFEFMVTGLGEKTVGAGGALRDTARAYDDIDFTATVNIDTSGAGL